MSQDTDEIVFVAKETLEGHQRAIMGNMTVEEIYRDRKTVRTELNCWVLLTYVVPDNGWMKGG